MIRNGVDPDDVPPPKPRARDERFRISYVGALYGGRDAAPVFAALRALIDRGVIDPARFELRIVGAAAIGDDENLERLPRSSTGYVDHRTAVSEMAAADVLLLYAPVEHRWPAAKVYEYLASERPVLCVTGTDNFAFRLVRELDGGPCVEPSDQPGIERVIEQLYRQWKSGDLAVALRCEQRRSAATRAPRSRESSPRSWRPPPAGAPTWQKGAPARLTAPETGRRLRAACRSHRSGEPLLAPPPEAQQEPVRVNEGGPHRVLAGDLAEEPRDASHRGPMPQVVEQRATLETTGVRRRRGVDGRERQRHTSSGP